MALLATGESLRGTAGTKVRRVPRLSIFGHIADAASLLLVVVALPVGILLIGAPIAFLIKLVIDLAQRIG